MNSARDIPAEKVGENSHACALEVDGHGVLVEGASGSGKTSVMFGLVEQAEMRGLSASMVSDDQVFLAVSNGKLIATAPDAIAGKAELRGLGIVDIPFMRQCAVDLVVRLVPDETVERMPEDKTIVVNGLELPLLLAPERHETHAVRLILQKLSGMSLRRG